MELKKITIGVLAIYLGITTALSGQSKAQVTGRVLIDGQPAGQNEKVVLYNKKGNDTLKTAIDGYINGTTTDIEKETPQTIEKTVWIKPNDALQNANNIESAIIHDGIGRKVLDVTKQTQNNERFPTQNLARAVYFLQIIEKNDNYTLKLIIDRANYTGFTQHKKIVIQQTKTTKPLYKTLDITIIDSIKVLEIENIIEATFPGFSTTSNMINLENINVQGKREVNLIVQDNDIAQNTPAIITVNGKTYNSNNGILTIKIPSKTYPAITARAIKKDGKTINGYKRTIREWINTGDTIRVVTYNLYDPKTKELVDSLYDENIRQDTAKLTGFIYTKTLTLEHFKNLAYQANFRPWTNGLGYDGLKTFFDQPYKKIWIASHGLPGTDENITVTTQDQETMKKLIIEEIFPLIDKKYQPEIIIENPTNPQTIPLKQQGTLVVVPNGTGFYNASGANNQNGNIEWGAALIDRRFWQDPMYNPGKIAEVTSTLWAPGGID